MKPRDYIVGTSLVFEGWKFDRATRKKGPRPTSVVSFDELRLHLGVP